MLLSTCHLVHHSVTYIRLMLLSTYYTVTIMLLSTCHLVHHSVTYIRLMLLSTYYTVTIMLLSTCHLVHHSVTFIRLMLLSTYYTVTICCCRPVTWCTTQSPISGYCCCRPTTPSLYVVVDLTPGAPLSHLYQVNVVVDLLHRHYMLLST